MVTRVTSNVLYSRDYRGLEYGAGVLGTKVILVIGGAGCGAVERRLGVRKFLNPSAPSIPTFSPRSIRPGIIWRRPLKSTPRFRLPCWPSHPR